MFSSENNFKENDFFSMFDCIPENAPKCRKGEACVFGKWFTKKNFVNHFPNFNKGFSGQRKLFYFRLTTILL
jgi:hypothetical protein